MRARVVIGTLALLCAPVCVVPAEAVIINGVDYVLFGKTAVKMEDGGFMSIFGNVGVNDVGGLLRVGAHSTIGGTGTADTMFFGTNSSVATCEFNTSTGGNASAACGTQNATPALPLAVWPPLPVPLAVTPCLPNLTVAPGTTVALAPGCRQDVRVRDGATLILDFGLYEFRSLRVETGATLSGSGSTVNLTGQFLTEPSAAISDVTVTSVAQGTFEAISIGNSSTVNNSLLYAPNARMHLHQGGAYVNSSFVAVLITVEPIVVNVLPPDACVCIGGLKKSGATIQLSNGCSLNATNLIFLSQTCATVCPGPNCVPATVQAGATPTDATLNIPVGLPAGNYHVIAVGFGGDFCTKDTVSLP